MRDAKKSRNMTWDEGAVIRGPADVACVGPVRVSRGDRRAPCAPKREPLARPGASAKTLRAARWVAGSPSPEPPHDPRPSPRVARAPGCSHAPPSTSASSPLARFVFAHSLTVAAPLLVAQAPVPNAGTQIQGTFRCRLTLNFRPPDIPASLSLPQPQHKPGSSNPSKDPEATQEGSPRSTTTAHTHAPPAPSCPVNAAQNS